MEHYNFSSLPQRLLNAKAYKLFCVIELMGVMRYVAIREEVGKLFRMKVVEVKGNKKGALSEAVEEALILWLEKHGIKID